MESKPATLLVIGGANTGRSPMATALLRQMLQERAPAWVIESAGVIGYDHDPAEYEACMTMNAFGLDIADHRARSLTEEMLESATFLIAIDQSIVNVIQMRFPSVLERTVTLGTLAGQQRDIPDPYRMQIDAWMTYARELHSMLHRGLDELIRRVNAVLAGVPSPSDDATTISAAAGAAPAVQTDTSTSSTTTGGTAPAPAPPPPPFLPALERCERLIAVINDMPTLIDWKQARAQLETDIQAIATTSQHNGLASAQTYATLLLVLIGMIATAPTTGQLDVMRGALERLHRPVAQQQITLLATTLAQWQAEQGQA